MTTNNMKEKSFLIALLAILISSCTENILYDNSQISPQIFQLSFKDQGTTISKTPIIETISEVSVYMFINDMFYEAQRDVKLDESGRITLTIPVGTKLYFLSGINEPSSLTHLVEGKTTLNTFLTLTSDVNSQHTATNAPEFYTGTYFLTDKNKTETVFSVKMTRSVARFDLESLRDPQAKIDSITINNAPTSVLLFTGINPELKLPTQKYKHIFEPAFSDGTSNDLFRIYESNTPVSVTAYCRYNNYPVVINMTLPYVERNKIYRIIIQNVGAEITGIFEVKPWEEGETVEGLPDLSKKISIDKELSTLPDNVTLVENLNEVKIPSSGTDITLAFLTGTEVRIASIDGMIPDVQINPLNTTITPTGVISKFHITVAAQGKGRLPYYVMLNIKSVLQNGTYDQVRLSVAASDFQIEEVTLGGVTWMAFNARSRKLENQIYVLDGCSVEEMYEKNWLSTIGGLFQWGRMHMYTPWESGANNMGQQNQNIPWNAETHVPCPEGYRIPTAVELRALLPNDQAIPGTYSYNGETITAKIHTSVFDFKTPTNLTGKGRYISLTSSNGQKLFIPLAGKKGDKSSSNNPSFGQGIFLWSNFSQGAIGGWAWGVEYWPGNNSSANIKNNAQLQAEAFGYVRCLKN